MSEHNSVGIVSPQTAHFDAPLALACGKTLNEFDLVYETYGELNAEQTNAILICHALSGHHHAAGHHSESETKPGWWDTCIGPGKPIDTNVYFVVSLNNLGGCHGSTGPTSINPETGKLWGPDFPQVRVADWVNSQAALADHLGIDIWAAVIGGSLGGMQAMQWSVQYPERLKYCLIIASAMDLSAQNIAFNEIARQAIQSDPNFCAGHYREQDTNPSQGLALARMVGHVTYLSDDAMANKFGRDIRSGSIEHNIDQEVEFQVESYLRYQGSQFSTAFDANTYILMTRALDYFDIAADFNGDPVKAFATTKAQFLVVSFSTDWRFSPRHSREITNARIAANRPVSYAEIEAAEGHDAFLMPIPRYLDVLKAYLGRIAEDLL